MLSVKFKTLGCRLNQAESAELEAAFRLAGFSIAEPGAHCDVVVIHGCAITTRAESDSLRQTRSARRRHPGALIVAAGCTAENARRLSTDQHPAVDLWVGQADKARLPDLVLTALHGQPPDNKTALTPPADLTFNGWLGGRRTRAMVKIQDGCPFQCAYCIVPTLRPAPYSRPMQVILDTAGRLAAAGCREIVLSGANLGCYHDAGRRLPELLNALTAIPGEFRIRLSSIESTTVETAVIDAMAASDRICRYLHLPLQSGDDGVLRRMQRRYRISDYQALVEYAAKQLPIFGLGTDIIVGFPGETEAAFENTVRVVQTLPFSNLHVFPFSPRPGTLAATWPDDVPAAVKRERVHRLQQLGNQKKALFAARHVGQTVSVLVERVRQGIGTGRTADYLPASVSGPGIAVNRFVEAPVVDCECEPSSVMRCTII